MSLSKDLSLAAHEWVVEVELDFPQLGRFPLAESVYGIECGYDFCLSRDAGVWTGNW